MRRTHFISFLVLIVFFHNMCGQVNTQKDKFIQNLLEKMTLEEKLGQLNLPTSGDIVTGQGKSVNLKERIQTGQVGGVFNIKSLPKIKELQEIALNKSRLKIPLLIGMDVIHGYETTFPIPLALASSWDMNLIEKSARISALEATADGINWTFSPMIDIARDPRWGRIAESPGEDPFLASAYAQAMIKGYQGENLNEPGTLLACAKHFALYGAAEGGRDYNTVDMSRQQMFNVYFPPFKTASEQGVGSIMTSFNEVDGIPATANKWLLTDVLRKSWGFKGFVVTDYTSIMEMEYHGVGNLKHSSVLALDAGTDMDMVSEGFFSTLSQSIKDKTVDIKLIDQAVYRILSAKYDLGLFENPYQYLDEDRQKKYVFSSEHRKIARDVASQTFVLLKNEGELLPLKKQKKIALIGPLADATLHMPGTWSVAAKHAEAISLYRGLQEKIDTKKQLLYAHGCNLDYDLGLIEKGSMFGKTIKTDSRPTQELLQEAVDIAQQADIVLLALGEGSETNGESSSRTRLELPQSQKDLIQEMVKLNKPIVLLLFTGRPLVLTEEVAQIPCILNLWFPGTEAGYAISDVLFGDVNPSGKLTTTFPRSVGQIPLYYAHKNTGRPLDTEKTEKCQFEKYKSAYLDECNTPLFPFGYGLSYTSFDYGKMRLSTTELKGDDTLVAEITLQNTGDYDGAEIVQLYIRDKVGSVTRPVKELKGFQKVFLKKGESKKIQFHITTDLLQFYNYNLEYVWEAGEFDIMIGPHSEALQTQTILWNK